MWTNSVHKLFALSGLKLCVLANNTFKSQYLRMYPPDIWTQSTLLTGFKSSVDAEKKSLKWCDKEGRGMFEIAVGYCVCDEVNAYLV